MSYERGIISTKDRQRSVVRVGLPAIQVLIFIGVLIAGVGPLLWLLKSGVSTSQDILSGPMQLWPSRTSRTPGTVCRSARTWATPRSSRSAR